MAILRWLLLLPLFLVVVGFAIANRGPVLVSLDPFNRVDPALAFEMPLFLLVFLALFLGLLIGGFADWVAQGRWRRLAKREKRQIKKLEREVETRRAEDLKAKADAATGVETASAPGAPAKTA